MTTGPTTGPTSEPASGPLRVLRRFTGRTLGQITSAVILVLASIAFIAGGSARPGSVGGIVFITLGAVGIAGFGAALGTVLLPVLGRRPVLVLDDEGVHVPAGPPWSRRGLRTLPWSQVVAVGVLDRTVSGGKGTRSYVAFLPSEETADAVRTSPKAQLVALALPDVPAMADAAPWTVSVDPDWSASAKQILEEVRQRGVPVIDRRKK